MSNTHTQHQINHYANQHKPNNYANNNIKEKYISPLKNNFVRYANILEKIIGNKLVINTNFEIMYEINGENKPEKHLSTGLLSLCSICYRLALIDVLFENETPFIVLDDPFVYLDQNHIDNAKKFIDEIKQEKQIIYMTCHESRKM